MAVTLRGNKGSALSHDELDANFSSFMTLSGTGATREISSINAIDFNSTSDVRVKENIEPIEDAVTKVQQLNGVTFNFTFDESKKRHAGVIAQDVLNVLPEAVSMSTDNHYRVSYDNLVGLLIEAIKDQQRQITDLSNRINTLEGK